MPMSNQTSSFTEAEYYRMLSLAKSKFLFSSFQDPLEQENVVFWRHDVDFSLNRALALAQIESDLDAQATYFIRTRGYTYSILENSQKEIISKIATLGHTIGIHLEESDIKIHNQADLERALERDVDLMSRELHVDAKCFSFHNPNTFMLQFNSERYLNLTNSYGKKFFEDIEYVSDSNGYWRFKSLEEVLSNKDISRLQVLTHPEWWTPEAMQPAERLKRALFGRARSNLKRHENELALTGRNSESEK